MHVLVTGATGYIGGRLIPELLEQSYRVRVLVRDSTRLRGRCWSDRVEIAEGDVAKPDTLREALRDIGAAYYFIHAMHAGSDYLDRDIDAAGNFGSACRESGVQRIIYLGGLGDPQVALSEHLRSRQITGDVLRESGVPVTEFRAAVIVGSGSASFEIIRYLTDRLPVMICPRWVYTHIQPIAVGDVLAYLVQALSTPESIGRIIEIGGADVMTYAGTMLQYAKVRGLRRVLIPVPILSPTLSSHWVHWVTPVSARIARPLIEGVRNDTVVQDDSAGKIFPDIQPVNYETAVKEALSSLQASRVETSWADALISSQSGSTVSTLTIQEGIFIKRWQKVVNAEPERVFNIFSGLGGGRGWMYADWVWKVRGLVDRLAGGSGLRRGRRHPDDVRVGDALDFWRVEAVESDHLLRLRSEIRQPGSLWLQFEVKGHSEGDSRLVQTLFYAPKGLWGLLYWYIFYAAHHIVFTGVVNQIALKAGETNAIVEPAS